MKTALCTARVMTCTIGVAKSGMSDVTRRGRKHGPDVEHCWCTENGYTYQCTVDIRSSTMSEISHRGYHPIFQLADQGVRRRSMVRDQ
jgi:hypothetical protein